MPLVITTSSSLIDNYNYDDNNTDDDPDKLFIDLTEIGHGNFGAVYYVNYI